MQRNDWRLRVTDMLEAIAEITTFTRGIDFEGFSADLKTRRAVAYNFVILGEAARALPPEIIARYPLVPWDKIRGMRNVVAHEYRNVSLRLLWSTVQKDLPVVIPLFTEILKSEP